MSVGAWLVCLTACGASAEQAPPPAPTTTTAPTTAPTTATATATTTGTTTATGLSVAWEMHVEDDRLRIDYTVSNATPSRVTVADALRASGEFDPDTIVVHAAGEPDTIAFARAFVWPGDGFRPERPPAPHFRDVAPGAQLLGTAHTRLPLGASHNFSASYAITGARSKAVLELEYYDYPDVDASNAGRASYETRPFKLLRSVVAPLPAGVTVASPDDQVRRSHGNVVLPR